MSARGITINHSSVLVVEECCNCSVIFAISSDMQTRLRENHNLFYCPNGHGQQYSAKSKEQIQKERAEALEWRLANKDEDLRAERASHIATKGQLTKARKRADAGTCQHCKRSYVDVRRHMASKHPDHAAAGFGDGTTTVTA